jgi:glycosyltransferase involved in cell wall biosynthesis
VTRRPSLLYGIAHPNLYGTERMALATLEALAADYEPTLVGPPGASLDEARHRGLGVVEAASTRDFLAAMWRRLAADRSSRFISTRVSHSLAFVAMSALRRRPAHHLHVVHGGGSDRYAYARRRRLNGLPVRLVAVSSFVRERLLAYGVRGAQVEVVENFLTDAARESAPRRGAFVQDGVRSGVVVSRLEPLKQVGLLLDAVERAPALREIAFRIFGDGPERPLLAERARSAGLNATFEGYSAELPGALGRADLLVHLCATEPFGLAILEAMAADVPVLVPDRGGAGSLVCDGATGFRFAANDAGSLAAQLERLRHVPARELNVVVAGARAQLATRWSQRARTDDLRRLLAAGAQREDR